MRQSCFAPETFQYAAVCESAARSFPLCFNGWSSISEKRRGGASSPATTTEMRACRRSIFASMLEARAPCTANLSFMYPACDIVDLLLQIGEMFFDGLGHHHRLRAISSFMISLVPA